MIEIPLTGAPKESVDVDLIVRPVTILIKFSPLMGIWTIDIFDHQVDPPVPLIQGVTVVLGADLLAPYALDLGVMVAVANDRPKEDAGSDELGSRVKLIHGTAEEFQSANSVI